MNDIHLDHVIRRLDLNLLKVFAVLMETRSVAAAADRLGLTPSAVSHALTRLRRSLEDRLLVRDGRMMVPTTRGEALYRTCSAVLRLLASELADSRTADEDLHNTPIALRIAAPGALELTLIPAFAALLRQRAPAWTLTVEPFERRSYEIDLISGRVDLVLAVGGHTPLGQHVARDIVWEDELVVLAGPGAKLTDGAELTLDAYLARKQVYPLPWPTTLNYLDVALAREGRHRQFAVAAPSYAGVGPMLATSDLIASMPDRTAAAIRRAYPSLSILGLHPRRRSHLDLLAAARRVDGGPIAAARTLLAEAASTVRRGVPGVDADSATAPSLHTRVADR